MLSSVIIVEDNAAVRESVEQVLVRSREFNVLAVCSNGEQALKLIPKEEPDLVVMDIELPDVSGIECTARLKEKLPDVQILILTVYKNSEQIFKALEAGASGYLLKRSDPDEIVAALREVRNGGAPMSSEIARKVVQSFRRPPAAAAPSELQNLTKREEEILGYLAQGFTSKEIAERLAISYDTVSGHLKNIYHKLHVRSRTEAVIKFLNKS